MTTNPAHETRIGQTPPPRKALIAAGIGNTIEWYDFVIFGTLAMILSHHFYSGASQVTGLLATFATFGVAFLFRPLGGAFFGHLGDRIGRRRVLAIVVGITSGATFLVGFLPSDGSIGWASPALLVLLRCIQGFGAGGEMTGAAAYLLESAPPRKEGLYASAVGATAVLGVVVGVLGTTLLSAATSEEFMLTWGWRIAFWVAGPFGLVALYVRVRLAETHDFTALQNDGEVHRRPLAVAFKSHKRQMMASVAFTTGHSAGLYFLISFMTSYLVGWVGIARTEALTTNLIATSFAVMIAVATGAASDIVGRKSLGLTAFAVYLVAIPPAFLLLGQGTFTSALIGQLLLALPAGMTSGLVTILQVELFPSDVRYSAGGVSYNCGQVLGGAFTPYVATALIANVSEWSAFAYLILLVVLSLAVAGYCMKESRPGRGSSTAPSTTLIEK